MGKGIGMGMCRTILAGFAAALAHMALAQTAALPATYTGPWRDALPPDGWTFSGLGAPDYLPGFDGFEFLDIVKRKHGLVDVPILVVSSATDTAMKPLHELPLVHVFAKPLRPALLQKLIRQILPAAASVSPSRSPPIAFDVTQLEAFVGTDWHLQRQIARQFYELAPDRIAKLEQAARVLDYEGLGGWCHTLTGTAAMIGANALGESVERLHRAVERRDVAAVRTEADLAVRELRHVAVVLDHDFDLDDANS